MRRAALAALLTLSGLVPAAAGPNDDVAPKIDFAPRLGARLPLEAWFRDESGRRVTLGGYFKPGRPVILALVYYECPMLCTLTLNGLLRGLGVVKASAGKDFEVIAVSIDPAESYELAAKKKALLLQSYERPGAFDGWRLLTGREDQIEALTRSCGFKYVYDAKTGQFAHAAGILIATPDGRISRAFDGVEFPPEELRLALLEARSGKLGAFAARALLYCYRYDPSIGKYSASILKVLRAAGLLTMIALGAWVARMLRSEAA